MKAIFLGTGTSVGIPVIGCDCKVCKSPDPRNRRRRASLYLQTAETHIVVDTPPDFREQALQYGIRRVDAVLLTHSHADHIFGFDDIRRFNTIQKAVIPVYGSAAVIADMRRIFPYVKTEPVPGLFRPQVMFHEITAPWTLGAVRVEPLPVEHGTGDTLGFRFECEGRTLVYVPDCHAMPEPSLDRARGVDVMVLDGLRHKPHGTHMTVEQSVALLRRSEAKQSFLIHMCHDLDHAETEAGLPAGIKLSYDGLVLDW